MFFETLGGRLIPTRRIEEIRFSHRDGKNRIFSVDLSQSDEVVQISGETYEKIKTQSIAIVPAASGTMLIDANDIAEEPITADVIAWAFNANGDPTPVTADGLNDGCVNEWAIVHPNGRVALPAQKNFDDVAQYVEYIRERQKPKVHA